MLKAGKKEHKVEVDDDEVEHQLSLKAVLPIHKFNKFDISIHTVFPEVYCRGGVG